MYKVFTLLIIICAPLFGLTHYCSYVGPNTDIDSNVDSVNLPVNSVLLGCVGCQWRIGLRAFSNLSSIITSVSNNALTVQLGRCGNYMGIREMWIDSNSDVMFTSSESIGTNNLNQGIDFEYLNFEAVESIPLLLSLNKINVNARNLIMTINDFESEIYI